MDKYRNKQEKAVVLLIVIATIVLVVILANVALNIVLSNSKLTNFQITRIKGYYAAQAGINYALDMLRRHDVNWPLPVTVVGGFYTRAICRASSTDCTAADSSGSPLIDSLFPTPINRVEITVSAIGVNECIDRGRTSACVTARAIFPTE